MDKRQLIETIRTLNEHAEPKFLQQFAETDLAQYLERLQQASTRNIRLKRWVRPAKRESQREYRMVS